MKRLVDPPVIGITSSMANEEKGRKFPTAYSFDYLKRSYYEAVERSGGVAIALPNTSKLELVDQLLSMLNGLLISGGNDVDPSFYGEKRKTGKLSVTLKRDLFEKELAKKAKARRMPVFAICRGLQLANVAFGGSLYQDFRMEPKFMNHTLEGSTIYNKEHPVTIEQSSRLFGIIGKKRVTVNTSHHQMVKRIAPGWVVSARSKDDGVIEGIEPKNDVPIICVQWHPELMSDKSSKNLFDWLIRSADQYRLEKSVNRKR